MRELLLLFVMIGSFCSIEAQEVGALVGVHLDNGYETIWVAISGEKASSTVLPELIVPSGNRFWRIGEREYCTVEDIGGQSSDQDSIAVAFEEEKVRWIVPVDSTPKIPAGMTCVQARNEADALRKQLMREAEAKGTKPETGLFDDATCSTSSNDVTFVNGKVLSEESGGSSECGAHPDANMDWKTRRWPALVPFDLSNWYRGDLAELYWKLFTKKQKSAYQMSDDELAQLRSEGEQSSEYQPIPSRWVAYHAEGKVHLRGFVKTHRLAGYFTNFDLPITPPTELFGADHSSKYWPEMKQKVVNAHDVYVPPTEDVALVVVTEGTAGGADRQWLRKTKLMVYELRGGKLGRELFRVDAGAFAQIVMVEWATGAHVSRWDGLLRGWAKNGLTQPIEIEQKKDEQ